MVRAGCCWHRCVCRDPPTEVGQGGAQQAAGRGGREGGEGIRTMHGESTDSASSSRLLCSAGGKLPPRSAMTSPRCGGHRAPGAEGHGPFPFVAVAHLATTSGCCCSPLGRLAAWPYRCVRFAVPPSRDRPPPPVIRASNARPPQLGRPRRPRRPRAPAVQAGRLPCVDASVAAVARIMATETDGAPSTGLLAPQGGGGHLGSGRPGRGEEGAVAKGRGVADSRFERTTVFRVLCPLVVPTLVN